MGPLNGISEIASAADDAIIAHKVRGAFVADGQDRGNDLRVKVIPVGEQRPDRPVDETRGEDLFFALTALRA